MDNDWRYIDMDDKPTRWGPLDPESLHTPTGYVDRGVNGLEIFAFMHAVYAITGDDKFEIGFQQLVDLGYLNHMVRQTNIFPPESLAPWDDNLAYRSYYTLFRYTEDPELRSVFLRSLEHSYEVKRIDKVIEKIIK